MKLILGRVNPLHVVDVKEIEETEKGFITQVGTSDGRNWYSSTHWLTVASDLLHSLEELHRPHPQIVERIVHVDRIEYRQALTPSGTDVADELGILNRWEASGKVYLTVPQKDALRRLLASFDGGSK